MSNYTYLTQGGFEKIKAELDELKGKGRDEAARAIAEAREKGDLSENAEYDAAKTAQGMLELRINELEKVLANARILDESQLDSSSVSILSTVRVLNLKLNKEAEYTLVSEAEADIKTGRISVSSPIGSGLMGKAVGDVAEVTTPAGLISFKIIEIRIDH
jgi:transcription elongation factor GreA